MSVRIGGWLSLALLIVAGCGGGGVSGSPSPGAAIKIGMIADLTGSYATLGGYGKKAALQAVDEINSKGGIGGRKIDLEILDDQTKPEQAVISYNQLVGDGAVAVLGPAFSNDDLAILANTDQKKVPVVSVAASDAQVEPVHPYLFMTAPTTTVLAVNLLKYLRASGLTRITVAHDTKSAYADSGSGHMREMAGQYGVTIASDEPFETTQSDFTPLLTHVKATNPQVLVVWATGAPAVTITKQVGAQSLKIPLVMTAAEGTPLYYRPSAPASEGVTVQVTLGVVGQSVPAGNPAKPLIDAAAGRYQQQNGGEYPPEFFWDSYVAFQLIFDAIRRKGATPSGIKAGLESANLLTPQGRWKYTKTQHWGLPPESVIIAEVRNQSLVPNDFGRQTLAGAKQ